jgi:hypothetical protein
MTYYGNYLGPENLVNPNDIQIITTSTALSQASYGVTYLVQASGSTTITLPPLLAGSITLQIILVNDSSTGTVTINTAGTNQIRVLGVATNNFVLTSGDTVIIENNGATWSIVDNSSWKANLASPSFTGSPTVPTAAQFNNSNVIANTAFVKTAAGSFSGQTILSSATVLTPSAMGQIMLCTPGTTAMTHSLPPSATIPVGTVITFINGNTGAVTIAPQGSDQLWIGGGGQVNPVLGVGDTAEISYQGGAVWEVVSGSAQLGSAAKFAASIANSGYQKLPSGLIIQWGSISGTTTTTVTTFNATLAIAFPNAAIAIIGSRFNDVNSSASPITDQTFTLSATTASVTAARNTGSNADIWYYVILGH